MRNKHIITLKNDIAIELDGSKSVEAVKGQNRDLSFLGSFDFWKVHFVCPGLVRNPFGLELIES